MQFKGQNIPDILTPAGVLDRTLKLLRFRFLPYLKISLITYVPPLLVVMLIWNLDIIKLDEWIKNDDFNTDLVFFAFFVTIPTLLADVANQIYTSSLIHDREITWIQAIKKAFSKQLLVYTLVRMVGAVMMVLVGSIGLLLNLIPFVGFLVYWTVVIGTYTFGFGLAAPVIIEEQTFNPFKVVVRNGKLGATQFWGGLLASVAGTMILFCLMLCLLITFILAALLVIALVEGQHNWVVMDDFNDRFILNLMLILVPLLFGLLFTPLKSIFFSVLYYNFRSRREAFHLENQVDIYLAELEQQQAELENDQFTV